MTSPCIADIYQRLNQTRPDKFTTIFLCLTLESTGGDVPVNHVEAYSKTTTGSPSGASFGWVITVLEST